MATFKFDKDAVSENIRTLISIGIGSAAPDGVPSFGNNDVELHHEAIGRTGTPVSGTAPLGQNTSGRGMNFKELDNPQLAGRQNLVTRIGELQGQQFENKAALEEMVRSDIAFNSAQNQVDVLTDALRLMPPGERKNEVTRSLAQASAIRDKAQENAVKRAGSELNTKNALLDADIARLESQRVALAEQEARARASKPKDTAFPVGTIGAVMTSGVAATPQDADKFLKSSPPATQEMFRKGSSRFNTGTPLEYWDGLIDAGGRVLYQDFLVNSVPVDQQDNMRDAIVKMDANIVRARAGAKASVAAAVKDADAERRKEFNDNPELIAEMEQQAFDATMRQSNYNNYQARALGASPTDIDQSWFGQNQDDYELAKAIQGMVNPNSTSIEQAYAAAAKNIVATRGISQQRAVGITGKILDNLRSQFNSVNKPLGAGVTQQRYDNMLKSFSFNMIALDKIKAEEERLPGIVEDLQRLPGVMEERRNLPKSRDLTEILGDAVAPAAPGPDTADLRNTPTGVLGRNTERDQDAFFSFLESEFTSGNMPQADKDALIARLLGKGGDQ